MELADLARQVPTPANVALYAPWGSGKTGLAQVLAAEFEDDPTVRFVHFDALKYAEAPLRRQFLSQLARELRVEDDRFTKGLYRKETTNTFTLPAAKALAFGALFLAGLVALMALMLVAAAAYGLVVDNSFATDFHGALAWLAPKAFVPATLLAVLAALAGKQLGIERTVDAPSSDEEFEDAFKDLVRAADGQPQLDAFGRKRVDDRKRRLVVFVDELDRCSPTEVASTLETIRTFLEVPGCLFIVAADQQALEEALSRKVKQATPRNAVSPYYSAGSAYLDKVFQYQLALPPLKPQRLTSFALDLVRDRPGVWRRIGAEADLDEVVSVLIPTHVQSPRRVKALLNNFALLYRLAELRADEKALAGNVAERAAELAKLACLRLEFPLFAADLVLDTRMPALVYAFAEDNEDALPVSVRSDVRDRARKWAGGELAVDELLASDPAEDTAADDGADIGPADGVRREHTAQLLRYLSKTHRISGPGRDLIHMESAAGTLDVPIEVADDLEAEAVDGNRAGVRRLVRSLAGDEQLAAYRLVANVVRHTAVGIEGANAVGTLLEALAERKQPLGGVADELASAIAAHRYELTVDDLVGAFELSLESSHDVGQELRERVLADDNALSSDRLCTSVVRAAGNVLDTHPDELAQAVARLASNDYEALAAALSELPEKDALRVVAVSEASVAALTEDGERTDDWVQNMVSVIDALLERGSRHVAEAYAAVLLSIPMPDFPAAIEERFDDLTPTETPGLALAMLGRLGTVATDVAPRWLAAIDPAQLQ
ncbi:MAG: Phage exclusion protein, partial [Chthonomonadaceae bacterium]|nr:Phage exclusion protein [Chthonomonadaceae bacterium]